MDGESVIMYADDTLLMANGDTSKEVMGKAYYLYNKLLDWCNLNRPTVNIKKTKHDDCVV